MIVFPAHDCFVGVKGFEPSTSSSRTTRATLICRDQTCLIGLSNRRGSTPIPLVSTKQSNRFESIGIPGKFVAGRLDSPPSPPATQWNRLRNILFRWRFFCFGNPPRCPPEPFPGPWATSRRSSPGNGLRPRHIQSFNPTDTACPDQSERS